MRPPVRFLIKKLILPSIYRLGTLRPIKRDKVVFAEVGGDFSSHFARLYETLDEEYTFTLKRHLLGARAYGMPRRLLCELAFVWDASTAGYLIYDEGYDTFGCIGAREGTHLLNVWHACGALKKFGLSAAAGIYGDSLRRMKTYPQHPLYDLVTVSSSNVVWAYVEAMGFSNAGAVRALGCSRTDVYYDKGFLEAAEGEFYSRYPGAKGKKTILYAPTFRGDRNDAYTPIQLDVRGMEKALRDDYVLIIKLHPFSKNRIEIPEELSDFAVCAEDMPIEKLLVTADICISDYSSIVFEYSLFERPMIFFAYDLEQFFDAQGFYYDYNELTPGPVVKTNEELIEQIKNIDDTFKKDEVHAFREKFMGACDGHATERIINAFFGNIGKKYKK